MPFHAELRQNRSVARGFNLTEEEVRVRFLRPLQAGEPFMFQDKEWEPRKTKLTVVEGAHMKPGQLQLGQGWTNAVRNGTDVTDRFVNGAPSTQSGVSGQAVGRLKERILGRIGAGPLPLPETITLGADLLEGHRVSERLGVGELAVWELLHAGAVVLRAGAGAQPLAQEQWQSVLLEPASWLIGADDAPVVTAA